jgi:hypothetical protein
VKQGDLETYFWLAGQTMLAAGCWIIWGWASALIAIGLLYSVWPLVKEIARR